MPHKSAVRIILGKHFEDYESALDKINLESLKKRREEICINFAEKCLKNEKTKKMFPLRKKEHPMEKKHEEEYIVHHANTERFKKSSILYMQRLLNNKGETN